MEDNTSIFWGVVRNIQQRRNNKRMLKNIAQQNEANRNVIQYQPSAIEAFFDPTDPIGNITISGGAQGLRNRAISGVMDYAYNNNISVVVLHSSNTLLESLIASRYSNIVVFNRRSSNYEPFMGLSNMEICRMIQTSATKSCEIQSGGQYYIDGMTEFIRTKNIPPYCEMYITCPHIELIDKVDEAETRGYINSVQAQKIKTLIVQGQAQRSDVENYFNLLRFQAYGLLANKINLNKSNNLRSLVNNGYFAIMDIGSNTNDLLLNIAIEDLLGAVNNGKRVIVIVDGLSISSSERLELLLKASGSNVYMAISADDVYAALNADDNLFASFVGKSTKTVIYQHSSGLSCNKWAEFIGYYEKQEVSNTLTTGNNYQSIFSIIPGQMNTSSINVNAKRDFIVRPEQINKMTMNEAYIIDTVKGELAHTQII